MHSTDETPTPRLRVDLPRGTWFVHEVVATWNEDSSLQLLGSDPHYGGTLICHSTPAKLRQQPSPLDRRFDCL
jgi:hypothetical protein